MRLSDGKAIVLFRFHNEPKVARERIKIIRHFNPELPVYAMFGGEASDVVAAKTAVEGLVESFWTYPPGKPKEWKWKHTDLMLKEWYRQAGKGLDFDFVYSYEYDLLTLKPLAEIYPGIDDDTLALAACAEFTPEIEGRWTWTSREDHKGDYQKFRQYLERTYGIKRQKKVCLGPGPLLPKKFMEAWSKTEDVDFAHDELAYPAYAEALGFKTVDHGMHPGFGNYSEEKYFNCYQNKHITMKAIQEQLALPQGRRTFHPVKFAITLDDYRRNFPPAATR